MATKVTVLPATRVLFTAAPVVAAAKRKVAGYARVSTDHDDQFTSYQAQIDYYTNYIKGRSDWQFVDVYTDEGITGTSMKRREGFKRMVADALDGKIDLIVTKSVSRFARNTVDSLTTIRKLKEKGVEVYFEKENIWTFDGKGELLLTIMSSLAQEESRSISENCTWGQRKRFADGKVSVAFGRFLGYDRGPDGNLVVNPEQAETVKRIFGLFLGGKSFTAIAKIMTDEGVKTPGGCDKWSVGTVSNILKNEKYKGDALLQKKFTVDFLTKKQKVNDGEVPQYYVEGNHEAIISPEAFDLVQAEISRRAGGSRSALHIFSGKIKCGDCGGWYGSKIWHSNSKYRRVVWRCNGKYDGNVKCQPPRVTDDEIKGAFVKALRQLTDCRDAVLADCRELAAAMLDTAELEKERIGLAEETGMLAEAANALISENARAASDQDEYLRKYNALAERYESAKAKLDAVNAEIRRKKKQRLEIEAFAKAFKEAPESAKFDAESWVRLLDHAVVTRDGGITFVFKNGREVKA